MILNFSKGMDFLKSSDANIVQSKELVEIKLY